MIKGWDEDEDETGQNFAICSQTRLDDIAHEQTIICRTSGGVSANEMGGKIASNDNRRLVTGNLYIYHPEEA